MKRLQSLVYLLLCLGTLIVVVGVNTGCENSSDEDEKTSLPVILITPGTVEEDISANLTFSVSIDKIEQGDTVTVDWTTSNGTATAGEDYTADSGTLTFSSTDPQEVNVVVIDDEIYEENETVLLVLSNPVNAKIDTSIADGAEGTITSDGNYQIVVGPTYDSVYSSSPRPDGVIYVDGALWIIEVNAAKLYTIDPATGTESSSFSMNIAHDLSWDGTYIWSTSYFGAHPHLYKYDTSGALQSDITITDEANFPTAMAYDTHNNCIWVVNTNSTPETKVWQINPVSGAVIDSWTLTDGNTLSGVTYGMCVDSKPGYLWMVYGSTLRKVSIAEKSVVKDFTIPSPPAALLTGVFQVETNEFWMVSGNNNVFFKIEITE